MDYQQARAFIEDAQRYGSVLGLENMTEMASRLGHPEDCLKFVHIAGTNGKGSVLAYVSTILKEAGYKVGRYISPTLFSYRGRIQVEEEPITREAFARIVTDIKSVTEEMVMEGLPHPTPFELETMISFLYFKECACDIVVMECGLGGDTDATNIIKNVEVSVITSISMDHVAYLGDTLTEIATHKAGIIVENGVVVSAKQQEEVEKVLEEVSRKKKSRLIKTEVKQAQVVEQTVEMQSFLYPNARLEKEEDRCLGGLGKTLYTISLIGVHQIENAILAIETAYALQEMGYHISKKAILSGLKNTQWLGRFSIIHRKPYFVIDGAHNEAAALKLRQSIETFFKGKKLIYLMGVFQDKEYEKVLEITAPLAQEIITIETPNNPRALSAVELAKVAKRYHGQVQAATSLEDGVKRAYACASKDDVILAFGSLSFLGEICKITCV